ncbi:hypothetical protein CHS0354_002191 [Potamilus streckersoni]|uniref:NACHT domain-containing protein n=1 Tax=Potamilus streckersoni TaxID=2493646 RepID=A0AAE0RRY8_9BIVA|nr:hypothetical protein CHS0354_002191 [Potamilus streckersoni]
MYQLCCIHRFALAFLILLDIIWTNGICGSLDNTTDVVSFQWLSVPTPIVACTEEDVTFNWRYQPGRYAVGARTWYRDTGKNAERIAYWNQAQGFVCEDKFKDRVERIGEDGLLLKSIAHNDNNIYTMIVRFPLSADVNPEQNVNLTVYEPPLEGCCRPTLHRLENGMGLQADLHPQACGTPPFDFEWKNVPGGTANGSIAMFGSMEVSGNFKVCVKGAAVQKCYKGEPDSLCQEQYIEKRSTPAEQNLIVVVTVSVTVTIVILLGLSFLLWFLCRRKLQNCACKELRNNGDDEGHPLTETEREQKLDEAMEKVANILYVTYKTNKELALHEISKLQLETIELNFYDTVKPNPTYKRCLYHKGKQRKLLIIEGDLGSGKMTWCRKFLKTWCSSFEHSHTTGNDTSQGEQNKDIKTLGLFPLLFFVSLRDVGTDQSPTDIIQRQCLKKEQLPDDLKSLITHRHEKIILLIHGADETRGDIRILNDFLNMNCMMIVTCHDWKTIEPRYTIQKEQLKTMASIRFKKIDSEKVEKYAQNIFSDYDYPENAYKKFMESVDCNNLKELMREAFFVQPLIHIWCQYDTLPSDIAGVCLCFIHDNLKKHRKKLNSYTDLNLDFSEIVKFIPRTHGMIFIINFGKALKGLGKTAYDCLKNNESKDIFSEEELMTNTSKTDTKLAEICIAAKLVSAAPVGDNGGKKRLRFRHPVIQNFMVAFYRACEPKSKVEYASCNDNKFIQTLLTDLRKA